ncbi:GGDEF domain-containing protein [Zavarzinia compransoris]|uniref:GGDEF domain-containing protein n=1 Tax=Zavarzinia marina TaxID=2911065 RepID=UPI001F433384|nr:GGDEF domain-containing protein [Zavarzinia marina]MCF4167437.1 GGDEF domain-containing protein [Zavarzinia marina]
MRAVKTPLLLIDGAEDDSVLANAHACRLFGLHAVSDEPLSLESLIGPEAASRLIAWGRGLNRDGSATIPCRKPGFDRALTFDAARCDDGLVITISQTSQSDPTWMQTLEQVMSGLPIGLEIYDSDFRPLLCNAVSDFYFEYPDVVMAHHDDWWQHGFPDAETREEAQAEWHGLIARARHDRGKTYETEWTVRCADGRDRHMEFRFRFIGDTYVVVFWDVTERRRLEEEWREHASTDALTGLGNRRLFFEEGEQVHQRAALSHETMSVLMIDIDHFKAVNDRYGHAVGDHVLRTVAERCRVTIRIGDLIARMGGEEFAVLLPSTSRREAQIIADRLRRIVAATPVEVGPLSLSIWVSIGGATADKPSETVDDLLQRADEALYRAKASGRNQVRFAD